MPVMFLQEHSMLITLYHACDNITVRTLHDGDVSTGTLYANYTISCL